MRMVKDSYDAIGIDDPVGRNENRFLNADKLLWWSHYINIAGVTTERIVNLSKYTLSKKDHVFCYGFDGQPQHVCVAPTLKEWKIVAVRPSEAVEPKVEDSDDDTHDCIHVSNVGTLNVRSGPPTGLPGGSGGPEQEDDHRLTIKEFIENSFGTGEDDGPTGSSGSFMVLRS